MEEGYLRVDPFSEFPRPLFLGAACAACAAPVCASASCSLFYAKRFCIPCAKANSAAFPLELQLDLQKRK